MPRLTFTLESRAGKMRSRMEDSRLKILSKVMPSVPTLAGSSPRIRRIDLLGVHVPLKKVVKHASHSRSDSENLVVRVELAGGQEGYGEGVPRSYVTGETIESTFATLSGQDWARRIGRPGNFAEVVDRLKTLTVPENDADSRGMAGNAAHCALELAVLDAYGRHFGEPVGRAVELADVPGLVSFPRPRKVRYGTAITADTRFQELRSAFKFYVYAFGNVKAKVGVAGQDDVRRVRWFRWMLGPKVDLVLDANEAWSAEELLERVRPLARYSIEAIEQPVPHAEVQKLAALRRRLGVPVMLDESLCGYPDAVAAVREGTADLFNVRLSKCGGILPSLRIIGLARRLRAGRAAWLPSRRDGHPLRRGPASGQPRQRPALGRRFV